MSPLIFAMAMETDNAHDEAVALVFHVLQLPFDVDDTLLKANFTKGRREADDRDLANRRIVEKNLYLI